MAIKLQKYALAFMAFTICLCLVAPPEIEARMVPVKVKSIRAIGVSTYSNGCNYYRNYYGDSSYKVSKVCGEPKIKAAGYVHCAIYKERHICKTYADRRSVIMLPDWF